jgi:hypothetical protein
LSPKNSVVIFQNQPLLTIPHHPDNHYRDNWYEICARFFLG